MKQLLRDVFHITVTLLTGLIFMPMAYIVALYAACREYRDYLSRCMQTMKVKKPDCEYSHEQANTW